MNRHEEINFINDKKKYRSTMVNIHQFKVRLFLIQAKMLDEFSPIPFIILFSE